MERTLLGRTCLSPWPLTAGAPAPQRPAQPCPLSFRKLGSLTGKPLGVISEERRPAGGLVVVVLDSKNIGPCKASVVQSQVGGDGFSALGPGRVCTSRRPGPHAHTDPPDLEALCRQVGP